jgi:putative hydrolase of the HAD superfamily
MGVGRRVRYDAVFLDVDGTLLWVDLDVEGYVEDLDWMRYFEGGVDSALSGVEKPDTRLFEEALEVSGVDRDRAVHVGNDPVADIKGAAEAGIDTVLVDRKGDIEAPEATFVIPDLGELPDLLRS